MTIGQRIAQKRKEKNLSQEALGEQLGVSRQAIYKWESDTALPEIDKLVTLSRLFGVTVGWLLGEEEPSQGQTAGAELTESQLKMAEEIAQRYLAAQPKPAKTGLKKRDQILLFALCGVMLAVILGINSKVDGMRRRDDNLQSAINNLQTAVNGQVGFITNRVEEILKAQSNLTADEHTELVSTDLNKNTATFSLQALPKTYSAGMSAVFTADSGVEGGTIEAPGTLGEGQRFSAQITCPLTDSINLSVAFILPDGTRETQLLENYGGLYRQTVPQLSVEDYGDLPGLLIKAGAVHIPQTYITTHREDGEEDAADSGVSTPEIRSVQMGLFLNQKLVAWAEPCDRPGSYQGFDDRYQFYSLPATTVTMSGGDKVCFAAIVEDSVGRVFVHSAIPYVLSDGEEGRLNWPTEAEDYSLDLSPADWTYGG